MISMWLCPQLMALGLNNSRKKRNSEKKKKYSGNRREKTITAFEGLKLYTIISVMYVDAEESLGSHIINHYIFIPLLIPNISNFSIIKYIFL